MSGPGSAFEILDHWIGGRLPAYLLVYGWLFFWMVFCLGPALYVLSWGERKIGADFQARVGPNRVGPLGALQGLADFFKLLAKRPAVEAHPSMKLSLSAKVCLGAMMLLPLVCAAIVPPSHAWVFADSDIVALLPLVLTAVVGLATLLFGFERDQITPAVSAVRSVAQWISYFFCALICLSAAGLEAGALSWSALVDGQRFAPWNWGVAVSPVAPALAIIFFLSGLGLLGLSPLDAAGSDRELRGGVGEGLAGAPVLLLAWARRFSLVMWANLTTIIFFGAWKLPSALVELLNENDLHAARAGLEVVLLLTKSVALLLLTHWLTRVMPRLRPDQSTGFAWTVLAPIALVGLILTGVWIGATHG